VVEAVALDPEVVVVVPADIDHQRLVNHPVVALQLKAFL
jgi:hypothetical protein